jgi:hypothetical protein
MRWLVIPVVVVGLLTSAGSARAEEPRSRTITLECKAPPSTPPRGAPVLVHCRTKGSDASSRIVVAFIDLFTPPYWHTIDPFATSSPVTGATAVWRPRSKSVDSLRTSASELRDPFAPAPELRDPFAPAAGEPSDEP